MSRLMSQAIIAGVLSSVALGSAPAIGQAPPSGSTDSSKGAIVLQLRAQNIDKMVAEMKNAGLKIVSQGGVAVPIPPNLKGALVADPNNFFLTPFAPCDGCTSRTPTPVR